MWVDDAHVALAAALSHLYPAPPRSTGISPEAIVEDSVELGKNVAIEPFVVIAEGARLGNGVRIGAHSVVGARCTLGEDTELKEHVCLYPDTIVGARCTIHSGARLGVDGYGYIFQERRHRKVLQVGRCVIEDDVEIGANTCIDRGSVGETRIGAGTKIDNLVHIAHNVRVGRDCLVVAQVGVAGSTMLGDNVALGGQVGVIGHITIGEGAQVAAQTGVARDIPAGETWFGSPARPLPEMMRTIAAMRKLPGLLKRVRRLEEKAAADES